MNVRAFDSYDFKICVSCSGIHLLLRNPPLLNPNNYKNKYKEILKLENNGEKGNRSMKAFLKATAKNWTDELKNMGQKYEYRCKCSDENGKYKVVRFFV
ncbi:hypothetical protein ANCCAN_10986 [Ancylostoma caninum]|uniref:Uncharacterized protein n=1 Tax=Ancylostoma caninum TaxID=29170 RepID=A0A368GF76_ANCCA|nr:hypothetical protein ANCCAN_10986 [Ancylostoma caninum]